MAGRWRRRRWRHRAGARATFVGRDREVLGRPGVAERVVAFLEEAMVSGPAGAQLDAALIAGPWGFEPADVRCPTILHHGDADRNVPVEMGRHLARVLPNCRATFHSGEGHVSLIVNHAGGILADLRAAIRGSRP